MKRKDNQGFTLIELMIVVAIIAILASVAYPAYTAYTFKVHRSGAQQALKAFAMAMEKVRLEQQEYQKANNTAGPLSDVTPIAALFPSQAPLDSSNKTYNLTVTATKDTFILKATPITGSMMDGDGHLELHSTGRKGWDQDGGGISATEWCWQTSRRSC